jgi:ABC-type phosphate/phosphonate transport system substrate-binding protein
MKERPMSRRVSRWLAAGALGFLLASPAVAAPFRIVVTQDVTREARKYQPLLEYLGKVGVELKFVLAKDDAAAAALFANGAVDGMFCGSGIAGSFLLKGLATPVVRPVSKDGTSTYWTVVLAKKGGPKFSPSASALKGKRVAFMTLASAGEFYFRSLGGDRTGATAQHFPNHAAAIDALEKGSVDFAIVKNRVWDRLKKDYLDLELVGEDRGENPDGTLIASVKADKQVVRTVAEALLAVQDSADAKAVREAAGIGGYVKTTPDDFKHTLDLLAKAGVTKAYDFR